MENLAIGQVDNIEGKVTVVHADGSIESLTMGDSIYQGDEITTDTGSVGIILSDETTFAVGEHSTIMLDEMIYDPETQTGSISLGITEGLFTFVSGNIAKTDPDAMTLNTPVATIGIRGTQTGIEVQSSGESSIVLMEEQDGFVGEIVVKTNAGIVVLNQSMMSTEVTSITSVPTTPIIITIEQLLSKFFSTLQHLPTTGNDAANNFNEEIQQFLAEQEADGLADFETAAGILDTNQELNGLADFEVTDKIESLYNFDTSAGDLIKIQTTSNQIKIPIDNIPIPVLELLTIDPLSIDTLADTIVYNLTQGVNNVNPGTYPISEPITQAIAPDPITGATPIAPTTGITQTSSNPPVIIESPISGSTPSSLAPIIPATPTQTQPELTATPETLSISVVGPAQSDITNPPIEELTPAIVPTLTSISDPALVNTIPTAVQDDFAVDLDSVTFAAADLLGNDIDADGDPLVIISVNTPEHGSLIDNLDGSWTYTPVASAEPYTEELTYIIADMHGGESTGTVHIDINITTLEPELQPESDHDKGHGNEDDHHDDDNSGKKDNGDKEDDLDILFEDDYELKLPGKNKHDEYDESKVIGHDNHNRNEDSDLSDNDGYSIVNSDVDNNVATDIT